MTTFNLNDILFVLGSFTCVAVPLLAIVFLSARYRIVKKGGVNQRDDHRGPGWRSMVVKDAISLITVTLRQAIEIVGAMAIATAIGLGTAWVLAQFDKDGML